MVWGTIASAAGSFAGNLYNDYRDRKAQKREYKYNSWLQEDNQAFQEYMAKNAHQMEMEDLEAAGLNPALTAHQSSAGAIAGSSAAQGTSDANSAQLDVESIVDNINKLRQTNANITNEGKQADAALKNADAAYMNAETQRKLAQEGGPGKLFGTEGKNTTSALALAAMGFLPLGIGSAFKGLKLAHNAYKGWKAGKGFQSFLNTLK